MRTALYWLNILVGVWLAASPWVLNFRTMEPVFYSTLASGVAVAVLSFAGWLIGEGVFKKGEGKAGKVVRARSAQAA